MLHAPAARLSRQVPELQAFQRRILVSELSTSTYWKAATIFSRRSRLRRRHQRRGTGGNGDASLMAFHGVVVVDVVPDCCDTSSMGTRRL